MSENVSGPDKHNAVVKKHGSNFCAAPFNSLHEGQNGLVSTCCKSRVPIGYSNKTSFEDMYNSEHAKSVRKAFLNNERHPQCEQCWVYEDKVGHEAPNRHSSNRMGFDTIDEAVANTLPDGTMIKQSPAWLDLLWSNKCNFACLGCEPTLSSTIASKYKTEYALLNDKNIDHYYKDIGLWNNDNDAKIDYILKHSDSIDQLHLNGGEPFMAEGVYELLDVMLKKGLHKKIRIWSHTNGSITKTYKGKDLIEDYLVHWGPRAKIAISQDGFGKRGEYIRYGYKDKVWLNTYQKIHEAGVELKIQTCWNVFNALTIDQVGEWYMDNLPRNKYGVIEGTLGLWKNMPVGTEILRYHPDTHEKAFAALDRAIASGKHPKDWGNSLIEYRHYLDNSDIRKQQWIKAFVSGVKHIDKARNTNFVDTFPELEDLIKYFDTI